MKRPIVLGPILRDLLFGVVAIGLVCLAANLGGQ
jgi:hypothetical protein